MRVYCSAWHAEVGYPPEGLLVEAETLGNGLVIAGARASNICMFGPSGGVEVWGQRYSIESEAGHSTREGV